jgi:hypothetical protein
MTKFFLESRKSCSATAKLMKANEPQIEKSLDERFRTTAWIETFCNKLQG